MNSRREASAVKIAAAREWGRARKAACRSGAVIPAVAFSRSHRRVDAAFIPSSPAITGD